MDPSALVARRRLCLAVGLAALVGSLFVAPASATNDPFFDRQWALAQIGAPQAWQVTRGAGVTVGIVDTGVEAAHPDLAGKVLATADCVGRPTCAEGAGGQDPTGHGTLVSGVVAAVAGNGRGVAGVAPDANLVVARALAANGEGQVEDVIRAIRWVVDHGARVVNLSLGDPNFVLTSVQGTPLRGAVDYAWSRGAVTVLASGNYAGGSGGLGSQNYGNLNALVVGATDRTGAVAAYSSPVGNAKWGLVAPGGAGVPGPDNNVISTVNGGGYASSAGTSMAAPHVAAALALLLAQGSTPSAAVARLLASADKVPCGTGCKGRLNVAAATGAAPLPEEPAEVAEPAPRAHVVPAATVPAPTSSTTTSTTTTVGPPATAPASDPEVVPSGLAAGPGGLPGGGETLPLALVGLAVVLLLATGGTVALVAAQRRLAASLPRGASATGWRG